MLQAHFGWIGSWENTTTKKSVQGNAGWLRQPARKDNSDIFKLVDRSEPLKKEREEKRK